MKSTPSMLAAALVLPLFAGPALAQRDGDRTPSPRSFLPSEYQGAVFVDLKAMREAGLFDGIQRSTLGAMVAVFHEKLGFDLDDADTIRAGLLFPDRPHTDPEQVWIFEGNEYVGMPRFVEGQYREVEVGGHDAIETVRRGADGSEEPDDLYYSPRDGLLVIGTSAQMRPVLSGERRGGVPSPELSTLTSAPGTLFCVATGLNASMRGDLPPYMSADWLTAEDPLTFMMMRLRRAAGAAGDGDRHVALEAVLRCDRGEDGPVRLEQRIRAGLDDLQHHRRLGALKRYWKTVEVHRDGKDVVLTLDLGTPSQATTALPLILALLIVTRTVNDPVLVPDAPADVARPPGEVPPGQEKPKDSGTGKD